MNTKVDEQINELTCGHLLIYMETIFLSSNFFVRPKQENFDLPIFMHVTGHKAKIVQIIKMLFP